MALLQTIDLEDTGIAAEYWRLSHLQADFAAGIVEAQLHGYRDQAARRAGRNPLSRIHFRLPAETLMRDGQISLAAIYAALRDDYRFQDSQDA